MTAEREVTRAIEACRRAGLPVVDQHDCTCRLRGQLVVLVRAGGLEVVWPYDQRCPIHGPRHGEVSPPAERRTRGRSRSQAANEAWARRKARLL